MQPGNVLGVCGDDVMICFQYMKYTRQEDDLRALGCDLLSKSYQKKRGCFTSLLIYYRNW